MRIVITLFLSLAIAITSWGRPKALGTAVLNDTPVAVPGDERELEGVGLIRELPTSLAASARTIQAEHARVVVARISTAGSDAARLYIRNMALGEGMQLYLYGRNADGSLTKVYGPFVTVGPLQSGEFWTDAIPGSEVVLELHTSGEVPADLPFEVVGITSADLAEVAEYAPAINTPEVRTSLFRGLPVTHTVEDGWAVFEGDILLGRADELPGTSGRSSKSGRDAVAITGQNYRWPGGIIPYRIEEVVPNQARVTNAIAHWNSKMAGYIQFVPRTNENAYVTFMRATSPSKCSSSVGRLGYQQYVQVGDYCSTGNLIHEIGHAVGLWHEQGREDRDQFVKINWENISAGSEFNFYQNIANGDDVGTYNFGSIMHYGAKAFSKNGLPTIETIPAGIPIGQRSGLNAGDIAALRGLYPVTATTTPTTTSVTIASNPTGMPVAVDGVTMMTPAVMQWTSGSVHTISALNPAVVNGTRNVFSRWTDGGTASHSITVPTSSITYRADYVTSYSLSTTATPVGSVAVTPSSADSFYTSGTAVTLNATAPAGYCFNSWLGLIAGTPSKATVTMVRPYTLNAYFQTGVVTASPQSLTAPASGGTIAVNVSSTAGCQWNSTSTADWVSIVSGGSGSSSGVVLLSVDKKTANKRRSAIVTIADQPVVITQ